MARFRIVFGSGRPMSWWQRAVAFVALAGVAVLAFFFLTVVLVAGAFLALVVIARLWWLKRKAPLAPASAAGSRTTTTTYEGEYVVIEHAKPGDPANPARRDPPPLP